MKPTLLHRQRDRRTGRQRRRQRQSVRSSQADWWSEMDKETDRQGVGETLCIKFVIFQPSCTLIFSPFFSLHFFYVASLSFNLLLPYLPIRKFALESAWFIPGLYHMTYFPPRLCSFLALRRLWFNLFADSPTSNFPSLPFLRTANDLNHTHTLAHTHTQADTI